MHVENSALSSEMLFYYTILHVKTGRDLVKWILLVKLHLDFFKRLVLLKGYYVHPVDIFNLKI